MERRRRQARRAWIPTGIIGALIVGAIIVAIVLNAGGGAKPVIASRGFTHFDNAGLAAIQRSADAQVDVRGVRTATSIGLPRDGSTKLGPFSGVSMELDLVGTHGTRSLYVDSFRVNTAGNTLRTISTSSKEFSFADIHTELKSDAVVGVSNQQMAAFQDSMPNGAGGPDSFFTLPVGTGRALGVPTAVSVTCAGPKGCTVRTVTTLAK